MTDFTDMKCPVCGKPFSNGDDIVVCPQCGAPYHRSCYQQVGHCLYEDRHGTKDAWKPPQKAAEKEEKICPRCGHPNRKDALFCELCGTSLAKNEQNSYQQPHQNPSAVNSGNAQMPYIAFDPLGGVAPTEKIDDISASDLAKVVQSNTSYYIPVFRNFVRDHKKRFNFCAFLFTGSWFLYRKQYKKGWTIASVLLILHALYQYVTYVVSYPVMQSLMNSAGVASDAYPSTNQMIAMSGMISTLSANQQIALALPGILMIGILLIKLIFGFKANQMYKAHCVSVIKEIETNHPQTGVSSEKTILYREKGGVNMALAMGIVLCYTLITYIPYFFF